MAAESLVVINEAFTRTGLILWKKDPHLFSIYIFFKSQNVFWDG